MLKKMMNIIISIEFMYFLIIFLDSLFGLNWYPDYLYIKSIHNVFIVISLIAFIILPFYGLFRIIKLKETKNIFNYLAILGSCLYLYPVYIEIVIDKAL